MGKLDARAMQPLYTDDGIPLHLRHWSAALMGTNGVHEPPATHRSNAAANGATQGRGTVLIVHGLGEHIGRYDALASDLNAHGWHVCGYDQRGHGASGGVRGRIARDDALLRDLARVIDVVRDVRSGPLVLLGHSMGGAVAAHYVALMVADSAELPSWHRRVDGLVLSSPALDLGLAWHQRLLMQAMNTMAPDAVVPSRLNAEHISRDPDVVAAYRRDPLVHDRISARLARFMVDAGRVAQQRAAVWSTPTLLMWAGGDRIVSSAGSANFASRTHPERVQALCLDGLAHEIFNEPERLQPVSRMARWLEQTYVA